MNFWKNRPLIITVILTIVLITLVITTANTDAQSGPVSILGGILKPVQSFFYNMTEEIGMFFEGKASSAELQEQNTQLQEQVAAYEEQLRDYQELTAENKRLRELLNYMGEQEFEIVTARIIGTMPGNWYDEFTIGAGSSAGIESGMAVYSADGLVGKVVYAAGGYARVLSIMDDSSGVAVLVERTRDHAVLRAADGTQGLLQMYYLREDADIVPGDKIITSGIGGVYPKGVVVGVVSEVSTNTASEKVVYVQSTVDFEHLEEVSVVLHVYEGVE
jgi:rod shape-determining protein MreC